MYQHKKMFFQKYFCLVKKNMMKIIMTAKFE